MSARDGGAQIVGREAELAALAGFLDRQPPRRTLLLTGGPGIGKTTLWEAGIEAARMRGRRVLVARPGEAEARQSLTAVADLLDGVGAMTLAVLPAPRRHGLEVALHRREPGRHPPEPRAISAGFLDVLRELALESSVLVAVDDAHWLDRRSADAIGFAARRIDGEDVGFLLSSRVGMSPALERALETGGLERVELGGISLGAARRLLAQRLGLTLHRRTLSRLLAMAEGNPLFVLELGRLFVERGSLLEIGEELSVPDRIEDLLGVRVTRLPRPARRALLAVALGDDLRLSQLEAVVGSDAVDDALEAGVLTAEGERVRASHPLLAAAVRTHSRASERRELHVGLAGNVDAERRARHLALAASTPAEELAATVAAAVSVAAARGAAEDAIELAEHALRLTPPESSSQPQRVLVLGERLMVAGEHRRVLEFLSREIDRIPAGPARARAHVLLSESSWVDSHIDETSDQLARAFVESERDPALHAVVTARRSRHYAVGLVEQLGDAERWAAEALPAARAAGPDVEREVLHALGWTRVMRGRGIADLCERFRHVSSDAFSIFRSLDRVEAEQYANRGEVDRARTLLTRLSERADERGEVWSYVVVRHQLCEVEIRAGRWDAASRLLDEWESPGDSDLLGLSAYERCRALLAAGRGDPVEAERLAAAAFIRSEARGHAWNMLESQRVRGVAALLAHDPHRAVEFLSRVWAHTQHAGVEDPAVFPVAPDLVEALVELGRLEEARAVTERLVELGRELSHPWASATGGRCGAIVERAAGADGSEPATALAEAADAYRELGLQFDRARTLLAGGRAERRLRKWANARRSLQEAAAAFDELDSPGWAEQARAELERVGGRKPRAEGELTPTEQRIASLATEGLSNKEIAGTLHVTVHTIEAHLTHIYAKLGVRSRAQLARLASARGWTLAVQVGATAWVC